MGTSFFYISMGEQKKTTTICSQAANYEKNLEAFPMLEKKLFSIQTDENELNLKPGNF